MYQLRRTGRLKIAFKEMSAREIAAKAANNPGDYETRPGSYFTDKMGYVSLSFSGFYPEIDARDMPNHKLSCRPVRLIKPSALPPGYLPPNPKPRRRPKNPRRSISYTPNEGQG